MSYLKVSKFWNSRLHCYRRNGGKVSPNSGPSRSCTQPARSAWGFEAQVVGEGQVIFITNNTEYAGLSVCPSIDNILSSLSYLIC